MVTGVLPIALGRACRLMNYFIVKNKIYVGVMRLHKEVELSKLKKEIKNFIGEITQLPPVKSRVKRQERKRVIYSFKILEISEDKKDILFETEVQAGTYIRKLCFNLGEKIGGAHMLELRRTQASIFNEKDSHTIYEFLDAVQDYKKGKEEKLRNMLIPGEIIKEVLPVVQVKKEFVKKLWHGSPLFKEYIEKNTEYINNLMNKKKSKTNLKSDLASGKKDIINIAVFYDEKFIGIFKIINENQILALPEFVLQPIKQ